MSFPYKALREKPGLVSPEGDGMPSEFGRTNGKSMKNNGYSCLAWHMHERRWLVVTKATYPTSMHKRSMQ